MSQAKVDRYKEEKKNRAKIMAREKRNAMIRKICGGVIAAALVVWAGFSVYDTINRSDSTDEQVTVTDYSVDLSAIGDYISSLSAD